MLPMNDRASTVMARVVELVLSWPCCRCGQPFPCRCDEAGLEDCPDAPEADSRNASELQVKAG
jgi:hypothetical protein